MKTNQITQEKAQEIHSDLREILMKYNCMEYGDCIVDEISFLFNFPTTIDVDPEEDADEENDFLSLPIYWSTNDFEAKAESNFIELKKDNPEEFAHLDNWEKLYDKTQFPHQLERMISGHDASIGITWLTLEEYLGNCEIK